MGACVLALQSFAPSFQGISREPEAICGQEHKHAMSNPAPTPAQRKYFIRPLGFLCQNDPLHFGSQRIQPLDSSRAADDIASSRASGQAPLPKPVEYDSGQRIAVVVSHHGVAVATYSERRQIKPRDVTAATLHRDATTPQGRNETPPPKPP